MRSYEVEGAGWVEAPDPDPAFAAAFDSRFKDRRGVRQISLDPLRVTVSDRDVMLDRRVLVFPSLDLADAVLVLDDALTAALLAAEPPIDDSLVPVFSVDGGPLLSVQDLWHDTMADALRHHEDFAERDDATRRAVVPDIRHTMFGSVLLRARGRDGANATGERGLREGHRVVADRNRLDVYTHGPYRDDDHASYVVLGVWAAHSRHLLMGLVDRVDELSRDAMAGQVVPHVLMQSCVELQRDAIVAYSDLHVSHRLSGDLCRTWEGIHAQASLSDFERAEVDRSLALLQVLVDGLFALAVDTTSRWWSLFGGLFAMASVLLGTIAVLDFAGAGSPERLWVYSAWAAVTFGTIGVLLAHRVRERRGRRPRRGTTTVGRRRLSRR